MIKKTLLTLTLCLVALCLMTGYGMARSYVIKFSHVVAVDTPKGQAAEYFKKIVEERTKGKVKVQVYPNAVLYGDREAVEALKMNAIQMACPSFSKFTGFVPELQIFDLPFLFKDRKHLKKFMKSKVGQELLNSVSKIGLVGLAFWDNGFKQLTLKDHPIRLPQDIKGKKFRIMSSKVLEAQFKAVGASPQVLPFSEVYSALQQGVVDGQENTISNIYTKKFYEVQKYMTISNHGYLGYLLVTNQIFWNSLPKDLKKIVKKCVDDATEKNWELAAQLEKEQLKKIEESGKVKIHYLTPEERKVWEDAMRKIYPEFYDVIGKDRIKKALELAD
ncbi:TRAP transporter substrate-binding protein [Desulfothermus okinawensis JCM 13304]